MTSEPLSFRTPEGNVHSVPNCPECGVPLTVILGTNKFTLTHESDLSGEYYHKDEEPSSLACGHCLESIEYSDVESVMIAVDER